MTTIHNLGFPRIGKKRELKFALENYWKGASTRQDLLNTAADLRQEIWNKQAKLDLVPVGDFSLYDQVLDMSFTLGNLPERVQDFHGEELDNYFRVARGRSAKDDSSSEDTEHQTCCNHDVTAAEMTKWFDTNYHYIVPEFTSDTQFKLNTDRLLQQLEQAKKLGVNSKPVIIGPVTYLALGKAKDDSDKLQLLEKILPVYKELLSFFAQQNIEWVQIDEPILVTELEPQWQQALKTAYDSFTDSQVKLLLTTYFGELLENKELAAQLPVAGIHVDAVLGSQQDVNELIKILPNDTVLSIGIINGRNIWKTDLNKALDWLEPIYKDFGDRLWIAPSCSLLHVPVDLDSETKLDDEIKSWLSFAIEKLEELSILGNALKNGRTSVQTELDNNAKSIQSRKSSDRVNNPKVQNAIKAITPELGNRNSVYEKRATKQRSILNLPLFPTTTIGSFPQTPDIRRVRRDFKAGRIDFPEYQQAMHDEIKFCIQEQEKLGLDVLVHGEAERNDMVEYFGEQLEGYAFSEFAWVQSYGSRCVKPPILFGDISRPKAMTVEWIKYAQSQTQKPMKGMLTGPVTILNWSFVRDDQPRATTCKQLALAIRDEVLDLEKAGVRIIQIDEAALREGLPLRQSQWKEYLDWAIESFRITANGVQDETQIHTHMCYSEFNDIISSIADMDADVITIETSRSDMELLDAFEDFHYPNEIGPGVYDIHSPNIVSKEQMVDLIKKASTRIPAERLWLNPDCGLKTRQWSEVIPALQNLVSAAQALR